MWIISMRLSRFGLFVGAALDEADAGVDAFDAGVG
jgi:hypothetical protein